MTRDQVFISYSHKDKEWLERLQIMLAPLKRKGIVKVWADTDIDPGKKWKAEIERALKQAKVAVLLVSQDFLASEFIHDNELPSLLEAAEKEGVTILWVPVRQSLYEVTDIAHYQAVCDPDMPLYALTLPQQDAVLKKTAKILMESKPLSVPIQTSQSPEPPRSGHDALPAIKYIHGWLPARVQALQQQTAQALGLPVEFRDELESGGPVPVMRVIPGGRYLMGSPAGELERQDNERQHEVEIAPFAMGKFAVTFEEYDHFAGATGREKPGDNGWGRDRRPVINVTWFDAVAYAEWLSQQTGQRYRLPAEAEWEYACRAGTTTPFYFGETISTDQANYDGNSVYGNGRKGVYRQKTAEVGQFPPNAWGLHDMHGNVWEWTCSVYDEGYAGGEQRCAESGTSGPCVLRGGSWGYGPGRVRGAARTWHDPRLWDVNWGFRLARTFPSAL